MARTRRQRARRVSQQRYVVLGTSRGVGKSVVAGALAFWLRRAGRTLGVYKPVSVGCGSSRHGLESTDVPFLAHCAESPHPLSVINPVRFRTAFVPRECARQAGRPISLEELDAGLAEVGDGCDVVIIEGVGGLIEPLDAKTTFVELAERWNAGVVLVGPSDSECVSHVLMAWDCLLRRGRKPISILLNRYEPESAPAADEANADQIARCTRAETPLMVPHDPGISVAEGRVGDEVLSAIEPLGRRVLVEHD